MENLACISLVTLASLLKRAQNPGHTNCDKHLKPERVKNKHRGKTNLQSHVEGSYLLTTVTLKAYRRSKGRAAIKSMMNQVVT